MKDARLVWDVWRRILRSDALVEHVVDAAPSEPGLELGVQERAVLDDYASDPVAADITIGMYRRGLARNALTALSLVPMTRRLLYGSGLEVSTVVEGFLRSIEYRDDGPNFWRAAGAFVGYLGELPALGAPPRGEALALEAAATALMRRLGQEPPAVWPEDAARAAVAAQAQDRHVASRAAVLVSTAHDLTAWLEDPHGFDVEAELPAVERHWLVHVPHSEAGPEYAELSERAARAFACMVVPHTASELAALTGLSVDEAQEVIDSLAELGAVVPVAEQVSP